MSKGVLNFEGIGRPIAAIKNDSENIKKTKRVQQLFVCDNKESKQVRHPETEVILGDDYRFQLCINKEIERTIGYIVGASGGGKSYFCKQYIKEYHAAYPSRPVYIISALDTDPTLDSLKYIQRIKLTEAFVNDEVSAEDFQDSLLVLDDTETITSKKVRTKVELLCNSILSTGRHFNTSLLVTSHQPCRGAATKLILNESNFFTIFPLALQGRAKSYLLEAYLGLSKQQIAKLKNIDSRAITFIKGYPQVVLAEKQAYILVD